MRTRERKFKTGSYTGTTRVREYTQNDEAYKRNRLNISSYGEIEDKSVKGEHDFISFIPNRFGGRGLAIEAGQQDKAGRYREFSIELGQGDVEMLIEFLQKNLASLGEFNCDSQTDERR